MRQFSVLDRIKYFREQSINRSRRIERVRCTGLSRLPPKFYITPPRLVSWCSSGMSHDQVDPTPDIQGEPDTLAEALKSFSYFFSFFEKINKLNKGGIEGERVARACLKVYSTVEGRALFSYLCDHEAYTVAVASNSLGVDQHRVYRYTAELVNSGLLLKCGKVRGVGGGSPAIIYALRDAPRGRIDEAANLYKDINGSHVGSLDEYLEDYDYVRVAEEAIKSHRVKGGAVSSRAVTSLLAGIGLYGDRHRFEAFKVIRNMGYEVAQG